PFFLERLHIEQLQELPRMPTEQDGNRHAVVRDSELLRNVNGTEIPVEPLARCGVPELDAALERKGQDLAVGRERTGVSRKKPVAHLPASNLDARLEAVQDDGVFPNRRQTLAVGRYCEELRNAVELPDDLPLLEVVDEDPLNQRGDDERSSV